MTNQTPDRLPPVPVGYVWIGEGSEEMMRECPYQICAVLTEKQGAWDTYGYFPGSSGNYYAVPTDSDLGRKILAGRGKPSWDDAPDWADWLAQDRDGSWAWFNKRPVPISRWWGNEGFPILNFEWRLARKADPNPNWRETLERRPEPSPQQKLDDAVREFFGDAETGQDLLERRPVPDLIIPPDLEDVLFDVASKARRKGYSLEWDECGIRGWRG